MLQISRVRLKNIRCFKDLEVSFPSSNGGWTVFVGDNATGKSALLRSIAMGLCDEASAAGLLKESDEGYIRRGCDKATIKIDLRDNTAPDRRLTIRTSIHRTDLGRGMFRDVVRQTTTPRADDFPWADLFVSGYGAGRGVAGAGDISSYSVIDAVYNMFNYLEGLQNPELTFRRLRDSKRGVRSDREQLLHTIAAFSEVDNVRLTSRGLVIDGPWGKGMPLRDLADGYRSAFVWIADLIGWALTFKPRLKTTQGIQGIVLVDEIEQHLHARWQRRAIADLRMLFPRIQFIVTTHSPLIASSIGNPQSEPASDSLHVLERHGEQGVLSSRHDFMLGWRMDQVLAARAFKFQVEAPPEFQQLVVRASRLAVRERSAHEQIEYERLCGIVRDAFLRTTTPFGRAAEIEALQRQRNEAIELENELFGSSDD